MNTQMTTPCPTAKNTMNWKMHTAARRPRSNTNAEAAAKCPPAILPVVPGEVIDEDIIKILKYYGIKKIKVIKRP